MNIGKKTIHALLLTFSLALFMGATSSYAFTVKDGENVIESPDESRWFEREGILLDGRLVVVNFFDGRKADTGLSVELSASDLKNSQDVAPFTGEIRFYVFIHNTSVFAELTKEDDAFLLKDSTSTLMVTGSDILQSDVTGGDYNIAEGTLNIYVDDSAENNDTAFVVSTFLNAYHNIYEAMLVKYKPVEAPPAEDADSPAAGEPAAEETEESKNEAPAETPTEVPVETPAPQVTEPATETVEPAGEVKEDSTTVKKEAKVTIPADTEDKESEADTASVQLAKAEDSSSRKRTETTIMGEELKHKVSVDIPAGIDERTVSKFQKQISEAIDGLLQEIESNPSAVQERVSYQTYQNIENALSEGKVISAEVVVESVDEKFIPKRDIESFLLVLSETEESRLKIGKYFDITIMIMADNDEELGTCNEVTEAVTFTIPKPKDVPCPEGMEYVVVRVHNGKSTLIPVTVNKDGTLSFETDKFSTYALAVREVMDEEVAKAANVTSGNSSEKDEDIKDFAKWFLRILVLAFGSGTVVILMGLNGKRKSK